MIAEIPATGSPENEQPVEETSSTEDPVVPDELAAPEEPVEEQAEEPVVPKE